MQTGDKTLGNLVGQATLEIKNGDGLHMRPAMQFVERASTFASRISVRKDGMAVDGKSIMQLTMLAATQGTRLTIRAEGSDAAAAAAALGTLLEQLTSESTS